MRINTHVLRKKNLFAWTALGHFYKKNFFATIKKILRSYKEKIYLPGSFWDTIKKFSSKLLKKISSKL